MIDIQKEPIQYATEVIGKDPFATLLGIRVEQVRDSYALLSLHIKDEFCNAEVRTHGGVLFSLADQAFAVGLHSRGHKAFGVEVKINYFEPALPGDVVLAEATPIDIRKRFSLWSVELRKQTGERVALAHGMAYHLV